jgi:hypothetical protein
MVGEEGKMAINLNEAGCQILKNLRTGASGVYYYYYYYHHHHHHFI